MTNPKMIYANFNPWNKNIQDCAIRAISAATGLKYQEVCRRLGFSYKNGYGLIRESGASLKDIENKFNDYFDIVEDFYDNYEFIPDEMQGTDQAQEIIDFENKNNIGYASGITLNEFVDMFKDNGVFLVSLEGNPDSKDPKCRDGGHIVCVKCKPRFKQGFIDFWNSGDMLVDAYMRVNKTEPSDSPLHWRYDFEKHQLIP